MPGFLLHQGAVVLCSHVGQCTPTVVFPRVTVSGQPVVQQPTIYSIAGCTLPPPAGGPCVTGQWITAATRVLVGGIPPLLFDSSSICAPPGTPMHPVTTQMRATAQ
ncbi:MAG: hypothetical protein WCH39_24875 [Schlesneria sp.]